MAVISAVSAALGALQAAASRLRPEIFAYPMGANVVRLPPGRGARAAWLGETEPGLRGLWALYMLCDGIELPDVHVGYFIDPFERTAAGLARGEPGRIESSSPMEIRVFGSDGGGGRFAAHVDDGSIWYLPAGGAVRDGVYVEDTLVRARQLAEDVEGLLERLRVDVLAVADGVEDHAFVVDP